MLHHIKDILFVFFHGDLATRAHKLGAKQTSACGNEAKARTLEEWVSTDAVSFGTGFETEVKVLKLSRSILSQGTCQGNIYLFSIVLAVFTQNFWSLYQRPNLIILSTSH